MFNTVYKNGRIFESIFIENTCEMRVLLVFIKTFVDRLQNSCIETSRAITKTGKIKEQNEKRK